MIEFSIPRMYDYMQQVELEKNIYYIRLTLNVTKDYWSFSLYDSKKNPIVEMMRLVPDFELLYGVTDRRLPKGTFGVVTNKEVIKAESLFNGDATLVYFEAGELEEDSGGNG